MTICKNRWFWIYCFGVQTYRADWLAWPAMLTMVGSGEGLRGGGGGLSASSASSRGSSLIWICNPSAVLPAKGLGGRAGNDGWRLGRGPTAECVTDARGCEAAAGVWEEVALFPGWVCTWEITGIWVGTVEAGKGWGMRWRGGGGAPGGCWLGKELRGLRAGGGGRLEGIWGKGVGDWWVICLCEGGIGVVGGGLTWAPGEACGSWDSRKKFGGRWGPWGCRGCAPLRDGGTWNTGERTESGASADRIGGPGNEWDAEAALLLGATAATDWPAAVWGTSGGGGEGLWVGSDDGVLGTGWGAMAGPWGGPACGTGASANAAAGGTGSAGAPLGWADESESLSLPCWGLGMLGEELRLSWSISLVSLLPSSWVLRLSEELSSSTSASPSDGKPCGSWRTKDTSFKRRYHSLLRVLPMP